MVVHDGPVFRVEFVSGDQWKVIDEGDETLFVGTKSQVEDWLDFQENQRAQPMRPRLFPPEPR